jgi:hypothetical protein
MVDILSIAYVLYQLLWLWEAMVLMFYFLWKSVIQPFGKFEAVRLQHRGEEWFYGGSVWKPLAARKFAVGKTETHTVEMDAMVYSKGIHPVLFYNIKGTRPLEVSVTDVEHNMKKKSYNPDSNEFDVYATREGFKQMLKANMLERPSIMILIVAGAIGAMAMYIFYPFLTPPVHEVGTAITQTVTATASVTTAH